MNLVVKVFESCFISLLFGVLISGLLIGFRTFVERIQRWSDVSSPVRKWIRAFLQIFFGVVAIVLFFYLFMTWFAMIAPTLVNFSNYYLVELLLFIAFVIAFATPAIFLRKHIFREIEVKRLWE